MANNKKRTPEAAKAEHPPKPAKKKVVKKEDAAANPTPKLKQAPAPVVIRPTVISEQDAQTLKEASLWQRVKNGGEVVLENGKVIGEKIGAKETGFLKANWRWFIPTLLLVIAAFTIWSMSSRIKKEPQRTEKAVKSLQDTIKIKRDSIDALLREVSFKQNKKAVDSSAAALFGQAQITPDDVKKKFSPKVILWTA